MDSSITTSGGGCTVRGLGSIGLGFLGMMNIAVATGVWMQEGLGPSRALAGAGFDPQVVGLLPGLLTLLLAGGGLLYGLAGLRFARSGPWGVVAGGASALSLAAVLPVFPSAQLPVAVYSVVLGCLVLARGAERARPPVCDLEE